MSIFGNPLPYEDNTAASLIRRGGFPPEETYNQKPEVYQCPCCSEFAQAQERERLVRAAKEQKEAERRRLMQLDVFDERAKPLPTATQKRRQSYRAIAAPVEEPGLEPQSDVPAPPATLDELRRARQLQEDAANQNPAAKLIVTVHHGENLSGAPRDPLSVIVRCGAFEGRTAKVPRGKEPLTTWDELFEFPYPNADEPLEVLVVNDSLPDTNEHLLGGVVVPSDALHDRDCGNEELLPVMPEESMQSGYGTVKEGPLGTVVASWYVSEDGQDRGLDASALEHQNLDSSQVCTFVAHRVFQYTDNGSEPFPGGVLCVLRDTDDNCSESVLYSAGSLRDPSSSPYFGKEGYHYMPENPSQMMELRTDKKLGHILVCVPKDETAEADEEEELIVVGAVPLDFERLHNKGSAVLLVESKSKEDALWGEIEIEWANKPAADNDEAPRQIEPTVQEESLFVTAVRGLNLTDRKRVPASNAHVVVTTEELEGASSAAPAEVDEDGTQVVTWNQEIRFIGVKPDEQSIEVTAFSDGRPISTGRCLIPGEEGSAIVVPMHDVYGGQHHLGDIVVDYKRLHATESHDTRAIEAPAEAQQDEELPEGDDDSAFADEEAEAADEGEPMYPVEDEPDHDADQQDEQPQPRDAPVAEDEKPPLYTDADDAAAAAEDDDEDVFEEEEEEEDPVAHTRAAPVPEEEPAEPVHEDSEGEDPLEEEEEIDHDKASSEQAPDEEEEETYPTEDAAHVEETQAEEAEKADPADDEVADDEEVEEEEPAPQHETRDIVHDDDDEDEDPLEEEEEPENEKAESEQAPDEEEEETYPTEDAVQADDAAAAESEAAGDEEVEEEEPAPQHEARDIVHDDDDEDEDPLEEEEEPENEKAESEQAPDEEEEETYPTEEPVAQQQRELEDAHGDDHDEEEDGMYPTEDGPSDAQDKAVDEAGDGESDHDMYPTEDPVQDDAESDADKYEEEDEEVDAADDSHNRAVPAASNVDDEANMYPTEDAAPAAAKDSDPAAQSDAGTDMAAPKSSSRSPRAHPNWKPKPSSDSTKYPGYQRPWYPSGSVANETHIPYEKTKLAAKSQESVKELEARRARLAEESQRRGSSPRLSDDEL